MDTLQDCFKNTRKVRKITVLVLILALVFSTFGVTFASAPEYGNSAIKLYELGVLSGSEKGLELDRGPTRLEGLIILVKLLGQEDAIASYSDYDKPFADVPDWGANWVNYAYWEGLSTGISSSEFGSNNLMQARSYMTLLLKALEYDPDMGDFTWASSLDKAQELGIITLEEKVVLDTEPFLRDHLAMLSERVLRQPVKDKRVTLIEQLVFSEAIDRVSAEKTGLVGNDEMDTLLKLFVELPDDSYDLDEADEMMSRIRQIPENYIEVMINDGTRIRLINNPMTEEPEYEHLKGVVPRGWEETGRTWDDVPGAGGQLIVARIGYSDPGEHHGSHNLELHEIGHQVDFVVFEMYDKHSSSQTFADLTDLESNLFQGAYYEYDEEFFAEAFTMYYLNETTHNDLKRRAPKVYEYFRSFEEMYGFED